MVKSKLEDSHGNKYDVDNVSDDLGEMWETLEASGQMVDTDPLKKIAEALTATSNQTARTILAGQSLGT